MTTLTGHREATGYRLADRRTGSAAFGLAVPQLLLVASGVVAIVLLPALTRSAAGLATGCAVALGCALVAFCPAGGQSLYVMLPIAVRFTARHLTGRSRWAAPLPLLTGTATGPLADADAHRARSRWVSALPRCLAGLELHAAPRPDWAGARHHLAPVGVVRDRRSGTLTVVLDMRGNQFSLLEPGEQHGQLADWGQVLSQFARESSPVSRLGWSLWSAPAPPAEHLDWLEVHRSTHHSASSGRVEADYRRLVNDNAPLVHQHKLRVWITVDPRRLTRRGGQLPHPTDAALAAAKALSDRCVAAGLAVSPPLSPVEIAEAIRTQADPSVVTAMARIRKGLAEQAGLASVLPTLDEAGTALTGPVDPAHAAPLAVESGWDAVRVDGAWHRVFWVAQWPSLALDPRWLEPLLLAPPCVRTVAVVYEPISLRASRRRINAESVSVDSQLQLRDKHAFRVPVTLQRAHAEVDQREAELAAGFCEYGYLALIAVTGTDRDELDANCSALLDQAAQCGITELRPLYARQDTAWAATLPLGRVPDRELLHGVLA